MSSKIILSIVFLNYNRIDETRVTTKQLLNIVKHRNDIEIIAVDNGSEDGTAEFLQNQVNIQAVILHDNTGIAGYNKGFELARGKYILVLDDDSCPANEKTLDDAIEYLHMHKKTGVVACYIKTPDNIQQWSWHLPPSIKKTTSPFFIGCGFFIRRYLFKQIGWYPESFFLYQNEIDVAFKIYQAGFEIQYLPDCQIIHRGYPNQRSGWRRVFYPTRNTIWLIRTYYQGLQASYLILSRLLIGLLRAIQFNEMSTYFKAIYGAFKKPVKKQPLTLEIQHKTQVFWKQNSIYHQILKKT